ncbi:PAS domain S-box protein [Salinirubellus salinus]|uniref:histidine kinase n=1 Tax=Salinirubellus salinus TaxID=1364945 RepID=A0A9E7U786_9EURY|nr:PAS domain S-box protein [Salinirubellus salinus]UWM53326.1 PAS domain S-box protein [Salinirubellus salinus]
MRRGPVDAAHGPEPIAVLHVDDEPGFGELVAYHLERENGRFDVTTATSVEEGLARLDETRYDCIVSDYDMPRRNGLDFLAAVREDAPDLPFVLFTGKGSEEVASEAISTGVTEYLQKETGTGQYAVLANRVENAVEQYRATAAFEASQRRLSLFVEQSPLGVLEYDEDFEIVRVNEVGQEILGYAEDELLGESWDLLVSEESYDDVDSVTTDLAQQVGGHRSVDENVRKDGERIVCEWHNRIVTDDDGDVVSIVSLFQDVTERTAREAELEQYRAYLEGSTDIITVLDEAGRIQYQSPSVTRILGYGEDELVGENGFEIVHPEDRESTWAAFERILTGEEDRVSHEARLRTADDEWRWIEIRGTDYRDNPDIGGIVVNSRDINERREREQALRRTTARLQSLFDESPDMVDIHDADGRIVEANPRLCELTGYSKAELTGMHVWELDETIDPEEATGVWAEMDETAQTKMEGRYRREDGSTFPVEIHIRRHTVDGEPRFIVISRDISDRKQRERQLEQFASVVSHDLRNPLGVAKGRTDLVREECDSDHLDGIENAHARMETLVDDLLMLAREGKQVSQTEVVDLAVLAEGCWQTVHTADATLQVVTDRRIHADRSRLKQLLENLFRNAVEHGSTTSRGASRPGDTVEDGGPEVTVTVGDLSDGDGFYVADDGPGIPGADRDQVFEAGFSTAHDGTGFGLSIVERIATAHGWTVGLRDGEGGACIEIGGVDLER